MAYFLYINHLSGILIQPVVQILVKHPPPPPPPPQKNKCHILIDLQNKLDRVAYKITFLRIQVSKFSRQDPRAFDPDIKVTVANVNVRLSEIFLKVQLADISYVLVIVEPCPRQVTISTYNETYRRKLENLTGRVSCCCCCCCCCCCFTAPKAYIFQ